MGSNPKIKIRYQRLYFDLNSIDKEHAAAILNKINLSPSECGVWYDFSNDLFVHKLQSLKDLETLWLNGKIKSFKRDINILDLIEISA